MSPHFLWRTDLDPLQKHKTLRHLCVETVIGTRVGAFSMVLFSRGVQQDNNCCAAQTSNYKKIYDFFVETRFRMLTPAAMSN